MAKVALSSAELAAQKARRVSAAKESRQANRDHEAFIEAELVSLQQQLIIAHFHHNEPRAVPKGLGRWGLGQASGVDFEGFLVNAVTFGLEAKSTGYDDAGFPRRFDGSRITDLQREQLDALVHVGAPALLALEWRLPRGEKMQYLIPWAEVPWNGRKSFPCQDAARWMLADRDLRDALKIHLFHAVGCRRA